MLRVLNHELPGCRIEPGVLVVDLGANRGRFSRLVAARGARVIAFEPLPIAAEAAERELRGFPNAVLFRVAVGSTTGVVELYEHANAAADPLGHSISASAYASKPNVDGSAGTQVLQVSLADVLDSVGYVDLLKVDIEGSELQVWPAIRDRVAAIGYLLLEMHEFSEEHRRLRGEVDSFIRENELQNRWSTSWI